MFFLPSLPNANIQELLPYTTSWFQNERMLIDCIGQDKQIE